MVALVVLFPVLLAQFAVNVLGLRTADSSALLALAPLQLAVLAVSAGLLALALLLVIAISIPFVDHALGDHEDDPPDADDALRALRSNIGAAREGGLPGGVPWRSLLPLLAGVVIVLLLSWWLTDNVQTIGTAFLTMCALLLVCAATMPVLAVAILLARAGFVPPEAEPPSEPVAEPATPAAPDPNAATSRPPPGAESQPAPVERSEAGPPSVPAPPPPAPPAGDRGSVPPPG